MSQQTWDRTQHEFNVQKFYQTGVSGFHEYHNGYLNFGFWTREGMRYEEAAENLVQHMICKLGLDSHSHLLDIGFGMGTQDVYMVKSADPRRIDGLDVTWKHVEIAKERARRAGINSEKLEFHHGTATHIPFSDETFTHLLSIEAPEHFNTREKFFHEAQRVLKPGGILAIADYSLARQPKNIIEAMLVELARRGWQVPKENVYGNDVFRSKLKQAGFKNVTIDNIGKFTIPGYYYSTKDPEDRKEMWKVRGFKGVIGGGIADLALFHAFKRGLCEYIIVRAEKD